jgi:Fur family ferric uptake transcriptional regulator
VADVSVARLDPMATDIDQLISSQLRRRGQRYTGQRAALVRILRSAGQPVAINDILALGRRLSQSSVYRNLGVLEQAGVVRRLPAPGGFARYELTEDLTEHHHHLICTSCGSVEDLPATDGLERTVQRATSSVASQRGFRVRAHRVDMLGVCRRCDGPIRKPPPELRGPGLWAQAGPSPLGRRMRQVVVAWASRLPCSSVTRA